MKYVNPFKIMEVFRHLNSFNKQYILLRNIADELPGALQTGKDIDILIKKSDDDDFTTYFKRLGYKENNHPHSNDVFLYGVDKFKFLYNPNNNILFDFHYQLVCRSFNAREWIPLDKMLQISAWENRRYVEHDSGLNYWTLSYEDEFISLLARSIFDKKIFPENYIIRIEELTELIDLQVVLSKLYCVFFKFSPRLAELLRKQDYASINKEYIQFSEY